MGPRCLPQGSPASPALTNAACLRLDRRLSQFAEKNNWRYTRYADDLTFSISKSDSKLSEAELSAKLNSLSVQFMPLLKTRV